MYAQEMNRMNASEARENFYLLLDETAAAHEPVLITGPRSNAVLIGEEDWTSFQETLHLLSSRVCASRSVKGWQPR